MADIDMIPRSYREGVRARRTLQAYGAGLALLLLAGGGACAYLHWRLATETPRLELDRSASTQAGAMRLQLTSAQARKDLLAENAAALGSLRGTGDVAALAAILDESLNAKVWFEHLRFTRSQELLQAPPPAPLPAGVVQARAPAGAQAGTLQAWRLGSQVQISGQALDNGAMTAFLSKLAAAPGLTDVRFLNSSTSADDEGGLVVFNATAALVKHEEQR
jgi:Tfp pilus assembly protein PilN